MTETKFDPYQAVTDRMIALMEAGTNPWQRPWNATGGLARSIGSGKAYRGINPFLLDLAAAESGWTSPWWGTYKAISAAGGQVRKGEKGTFVMLWKTYQDRKEVDAKGRPLMRFVLRTYTVFNAQQADDAEGRDTFVAKYATVTPVERTEAETVEAADALIARYLGDGGPALRHGGDSAHYSQATDTVTLPRREDFTGLGYYDTAFHELGHSTGHASRLDRPELTTATHFGDSLYSREELVAELTAAMLSAVTGIAPEVEANQAAYLASWIKVLRADSKMVVQAAAKAQKAADLIQGITFAGEVAA